MKQGSIVCCSILRLLTLAVCSSSLDLRHLMWSSMINTAVILPCCFRLSLLFAGFVVECGATIARHCRRRLRHISPDQGPRLMCECNLKQFPWGRAVLTTKFEVDSSYNCVLRTLCPNAPNDGQIRKSSRWPSECPLWCHLVEAEQQACSREFRQPSY